MFALVIGDIRIPVPPDGQVLRVGRSPDSNIVCNDSESSRFHAQVRFLSGVLEIRDLRSTNGTLVDGKPIQPDLWLKLKAGNIIQVGSYIITVELTSVQVPPQAPELELPPNDQIDYSGLDLGESAAPMALPEAVSGENTTEMPGFKAPPMPPANAPLIKKKNNWSESPDPGGARPPQAPTIGRRPRGVGAGQAPTLGKAPRVGHPDAPTIGQRPPAASGEEKPSVGHRAPTPASKTIAEAAAASAPTRKVELPEESPVQVPEPAPREPESSPPSFLEAIEKAVGGGAASPPSAAAPSNPTPPSPAHPSAATPPVAIPPVTTPPSPTSASQEPPGPTPPSPAPVSSPAPTSSNDADTRVFASDETPNKKFKPNKILEDGSLARIEYRTEQEIEVCRVVKKAAPGEPDDGLEFFGFDGRGRRLLGTRHLFSPEEYESFLNSLK